MQNIALYDDLTYLNRMDLGYGDTHNGLHARPFDFDTWPTELMYATLSRGI
jgi:hypothetical protein